MLEHAAAPTVHASDTEVDQLLHPSRFYRTPADVVADDLLTIDERRTILSSWASDACAVASNPALRQPSLAHAPVTFDQIMDALFQLDRLTHQEFSPLRPDKKTARFGKTLTTHSRGHQLSRHEFRRIAPRY